MSWELRSLTAINRSPLNAAVQTLERPGAHWAVRMPYQNLAESRRARLQTLAASARGHAQRFYVPVYGWTRRGSFPATELLTNNTFDNGTTGWTTAGGIGTVTQTAADGTLRARWNGGVLASTDFIRTISAATVVQYAPYAMRFLMTQGKYAGNVAVRFRDGSSSAIASGSSATPGDGIRTLAYVPEVTSVLSVVNGSVPAGTMAGDHILFHYASLARCALVDNGPNLLLRSDEFDNAAWGTKSNATVTASATTAPDGTSSADALVEATDVEQIHEVSQLVSGLASSAADYSFGVMLKAAGRDLVRISIEEGTTGNDLIAFFNLTTGAVSGTPAPDGAGWTNARAFIRDMGDGWYDCHVVGRKANAATTLRARIFPAVPTNDISYNGNGAASLYMWRARFAQSSVPTRGMQTTTSADSNGTEQTGGALYLKGLPASTNGLLLQGDPVEIITGSTSQLVRTRAPLNSDAAGLGYFEFEPPIRISPSDNAAVIIHNPMCRMMMENNVNGWTDRIGGFSDLEFAAVEDVVP